MFAKEKRGGFKYWFAHWCAYQMTALNLQVWRPKYLLHDWRKPWLMLFAKVFHRSNPYKWVQQYHRRHSSHHLQHCTEIHIKAYDNNNEPYMSESIVGLDVRAMLIDWECSRFTKDAQQQTAYEYYKSVANSLTPKLRCQIEAELEVLGLSI